MQVLPTFDLSYGGPVTCALSVDAAYREMAGIVTIGRGDPGPRWSGRATVAYRGVKLPFGPVQQRDLSFGLLYYVARHARDFTYVHFHFSRGLITLPAALVCWALRVPYVIQTHGMCNPWQGVKRALDVLLTGPILSRAEKVLTLSETESEILRNAYPSLRAEVLPNALPEDPENVEKAPSAAGADDEVMRLLFCGRLHPRKGLDIFVRTCGELKRRGLLIAPVVAGPDEGAQRGAEGLAEKLGVDLRFLGAIPREGVLEEMRRATLLLNPAPSEPFGMVMIEALACGLPVVAAKSSELAPMFERHKAVELALDTDIADWADRCERLLRSPQASRAQAARGRELFQREFTVASLAQRLRRLLGEVARRTEPA